MKTDKKIIQYRDLVKIRQKANQNGHAIVLTTGCYDLLHLGHLIHFNFCKSKGDILVVSVGNDECVRGLKGPNRPINNDVIRSRMIAAIDFVDFVIVSEEFGKMDHNKIVELLRPNFYVVPGTDSNLSQKKELIEKNGGKVITCRRIPPNKIKGGISTTLIEKKLLG